MTKLMLIGALFLAPHICFQVRTNADLANPWDFETKPQPFHSSLDVSVSISNAKTLH